MTLLKDNNYKEINVALLSLEADIKNKITGFDTNVIDKQLAEINSRIDKINAGGNNSSAQINDIRYEIEDINSKLNGNSAKIKNIEQKLSDIFSAENKVTDFNTTTNSGIYYWTTDAANRPTDYGVLLVNKYDGGDSHNNLWVNQIAYGTNNKIYFRQNINSGNWTEWKAVAFEGEVIATLTVNGKTYDGSSAVNAGVQTVANGGTGATDAATAFNTLADATRDSSTPGDDEKMLLKPSGTWYKTTCLDFWNYIKGKADSVYAKANRYYFYAHNVYMCLGTATLRQGGEYLLIRVFSGNGYNAILEQDRAFDIHLRTSNGRAESGLYYAGYVEYHLNGSSSSLVYVVQNSDTSFTIWVGPTNYTGRSFYTVENSDGSSWSSSTETSTSLPSGAAQLTAKQIAYNTEDVTFNTAKASSKLVIPIGAPSQLEDGCIWIER